MAIKDFLKMEDERRTENHSYRKFMIALAVFLMTSTAFMGVAAAVMAGFSLVLLALCVHVLLKGGQEEEET